MEGIYDTIFISLSRGCFLETDGTTYWWVDDGSYKEIAKKTLKHFVDKKMVYAKRVDDETTCYYICSQDEKEREKSLTDFKLNQIKNFVNI